MSNRPTFLPPRTSTWKTPSALPPCAAPLPNLPDQDRLIVTLLLESLSYKEIAEITGLTVNHVGVKISRIKHAIEQRMTEVSHGAF